MFLKSDLLVAPPQGGPARPEFQSNLENLGDEDFHLDETVLRDIHERLLEGYRCWLLATGRKLPGKFPYILFLSSGADASITTLFLNIRGYHGD